MTVGALRRGEPQVLADLLAVYGREIQGVAYLKLRNRADAEDVLMDTLLTALDRGSSLRDRQQCASGFSTSRRTAQPTSFRNSEEFWILGVGGRRLIIAAEQSRGSAAEDMAELRAFLDSIRIEP